MSGVLAVSINLIAGCATQPQVEISATSTCTSTETSQTTPDVTTQTPSTTTAEPAPTTRPSSTVPPATDLREGDSGDEVVALQDELDALDYWPGPIDGRFGDATLHAVIALQKVAGLERNGVVTAEVRDALDAGLKPTAQSTSGRVIEVDLARQIVLVVTDGTVDVILDTSTGANTGTTPVGQWVIEREIDGLHHAELGDLYRPKYFYQGVAMHGYTQVPTQPASHGCVRLTYAAMDYIWSGQLAPVGTPVWVY